MSDEIAVTEIEPTELVRPKKSAARSYKIGVKYIGGNGPDAYDTRKADEYNASTEKDLWDLFQELGYYNDFGTVFRDSLSAALFPPLHFVSKTGEITEEVKKVQRFWDEHNMNMRIREVVDQAIVYGTGVATYAYLGANKQQLINFNRVDSKSLRLEKDKKGNVKVKQTQTAGNEEAVDRTLDTVPQNAFPQMIWFLQFFPNPQSAYGYSAYRPVIHNITGLSQMGKDIFAAIKNLGYIQRVVKLDLADAANKEEKDSAIDEVTKYFDRFDSSNNSVLVFENCHDYGFSGITEGQTTSGIRLMPLMPIIEPALSVALLRFKMALGHFQQADSSRQILKEQEQAMEEAIQPLREFLKNKILNEIVPRILGLAYPENEDIVIGPEHDTDIVWDIGKPTNLRDKVDMYTILVEYKIITPHFAHDLLDMNDPYAEWDTSGFMKPSEFEQEQLKVQAASPFGGAPTPSGGASDTSKKQDARRNLSRAGPSTGDRD